MKLIFVQEQLEKYHLKVFSPLEFQRLFNITQNTAQKFLERNTQKGYFIRLKRNLYTTPNLNPHPFLIANKLYQPSYVSFETALSFYQLIPETTYSLTSATPKSSREFSTLGQQFTYSTLKNQAYQGYRPYQLNQETILIAYPEKALADLLYLANLGKKNLPERVNLKKIKLKKLRSFLKVFQRPTITKTLHDFQKNN